MRRLGLEAHDVLALVGFAALEYGVSLVSAPAAFIVAGVLLLAAAIWPFFRHGRTGTGGRVEHKETT